MLNLRQASQYVRLHRSRLFVVKIGGACLARPAVLRQLASEIATIEALGSSVVVFHGSGPQTDALQRAFGEEPRKVDGRRVTSPVGLRALRMATVGELNSELAAALTAEGARAVGVAAGAAGILTAKRRPPVLRGDEVVDFGEVGDVTEVDPSPIRALLKSELVPVLSPPASDGAHGFLNVNADLGAAHLAVALGAAKLILVTDAPGVLLDPDDPESVASSLSLGDLDGLQHGGALQGGMRVKADAIRLAMRGGVPNVHVVSGVEPGALLGELYTTQGTGTMLTAASGSAAPLAAAPEMTP